MMSLPLFTFSSCSVYIKSRLTLLSTQPEVELGEAVRGQRNLKHKQTEQLSETPRQTDSELFSHAVRRRSRSALHHKNSSRKEDVAGQKAASCSDFLMDK